MIKIKKHFQKLIPKSLLTRALLILLAPLVCFQAVMGYVFYERHIEDRLAYSAQRIALEISYIRTVFEKHQGSDDFLKDFSLSLGRRYHLQNTNTETLIRKKCHINSYIIADFAKFFAHYEPDAVICEYQKSKIYDIIIPIFQDKELVLQAHRKEFLSDKWHFLPVWSVLTALVLGVIAMVFLKNQIRPIIRLSNVLEAFGKGDDEYPFHPSGAIEIRKAGIEFLKMRRRLREYIASRTMMLAGVSHDLRTILTRFKLELSLMPKNEETDNLKTDVNHMTAVLDAYFNFINATETEEAVLVNINDEIKDLVQRHTQSGIDIQIYCDIQSMVSVRKNGLLRCILNLLSNAQRYGTVIHITVTIEHIKQGTFIQCIIEDNGVGVREHDYDKIFDPFYSDNIPRTLSHNHAERIGLGLSIARNIARTKGGGITPDKSQTLGGLKMTLLYAVELYNLNTRVN